MTHSSPFLKYRTMDSRSEVAIMQQKAEDRRRRLQQQLEDKQGYVGAYRARVVAKPSHLVFFCQQVVHLSTSFHSFARN